MENNFIPVISTKRCLIRSFKKIDILAFMEYHNNEQWMCYQGFKGLTYEEYCRILLEPPVLEEGTQRAIIEKNKAELIGDLYLKKEADQLWLGYTISPLYQHQGYIYEAVQGVIDWASQQDITYLMAGVLPSNTASGNLLKKLGFHLREKNDGEEIYDLKL